MPLRLERLEDRTTPVSLPPDVGVEQLAEVPALVTSLDVAPDGRLFLSEKDVGVRVVRDGRLLDEPFVRLPLQTFGEQGAMGLTLDPDFTANGYVYVYYTFLSPEGVSVNRLSRFTAAGDVAAAGSEVVLFQLNRFSTVNHIGGAVHFGPDGKIYLAVGDHNEPTLAQSKQSLVGKILRLNPDGSIPEDNPFFGSTVGPYRAIWATGLRNPFTFGFSRSGRMFINDVGNAAFEELNEGLPGANYGWPGQEGPIGGPGLASPLFSYPHRPGLDGGFAVTGSAFYEPAVPSLPGRYAGRYFFGDLVNLYLKTYDPATGAVELFASDLPDSPLDLDVDGDGNLLMLAAETGPVTGQGGVHSTRVYRFRFGGDAAPTILAQPESRFVSTAGGAEFRVEARGGGTVTYQWQRDGADVPGATGPALALPELTAADDGATFRVVVRNEFGIAVSRTATLRVTTSRPPAVRITAPAGGLVVSAGETVRFAGVGSDPEIGELTGDSLTWRIEYQTGSVSRPLAAAVGPEGEFTVPTSTPYKEADVRFRLILTARDDAGLTAEASVELLPRTARVTLASNVPNALSLDGRLVGSGTTFVGVAGVERELSARREVITGGVRYAFAGWSDGGARERILSTPGEDATLTAEYVPLGPARTALAVGSLGGVPAVAELRRADGSSIRKDPFEPRYGGPVRVAAADVTGDGVDDLVVGPGFGGGPVVVVYDGDSGAELTRFFAFEPRFTGGVFVSAADLTGDGVAEVIASPDAGGGAVVAVFAGGTFAELTRFLGLDDPNFRGGAEVDAADLDGDGVADLIVTAGFGGGPRITVFAGAAALGGPNPPKLVGDFFAFEPDLRNGVTAAGGDLDGDGLAELVVGAGFGGAPRVRVFGGAALLAGRAEAVNDFFTVDPNDRGGVQVAVKDVDGDGLADAAVAAAARVRVYRAVDVLRAEVFPSEVFDPLPDLGVGVYLG